MSTRAKGVIPAHIGKTETAEDMGLVRADRREMAILTSATDATYVISVRPDDNAQYKHT